MTLCYQGGSLSRATDEETPLQKKLDELSKVLSIAWGDITFDFDSKVQALKSKLREKKTA